MCLIHKWEYKIEKRNVISFPSCRPYDVAIRTCIKCFKKQKTKTGAGIWNFKIKKYVHGWETTELTKEESRDLKLKKLLK
jgi:hypothetical protein